jgi:competence protein ComGC
MNNKNLKIIIVLLILSILVFSFLGYLQYNKNNLFIKKESGYVELIIKVFNTTKVDKYSFRNITALELLELDNDVNVTYSKFGAFIRCINNICSNDNYYWLYYVNGNLAQVGAGEYVVKSGDRIEFKYGKI